MGLLENDILFEIEIWLLRENEFSTKSGSSIGIDDFVIPDDKERIVSEAEKEVKDIAWYRSSPRWYHEERKRRQRKKFFKHCNFVFYTWFV